MLLRGPENTSSLIGVIHGLYRVEDIEVTTDIKRMILPGLCDTRRS